MRRVARSPLLWTTCSSLLLAGPLVGQSPTDLACQAGLVDANVPDDTYWTARHPARTPQVLGPFEDAGQWDASIGMLIKLYRGDAQFFGTNRALYDSLMARLVSFRGDVRATDDAGKSTGIPGAVDFNVARRGSRYAVLNTRLILDSTADADQARSLCYTVHNVKRFNERLTKWARDTSQRELEALVQRWNSFNEAGLTPYPWELLGNRLTGWLGSSDGLDPPNRQLILLRPEVGAEVDRGFGRRQNVLAVELIGAVQYIGDSGWYLGGSLIMTSPNDGPAGFGAMGHMAQWLKFGPIWRDRDGDGDRELGWLLSIDAFDLFKGPPEELVKRAEAALAAATQNGGRN